MILSLYFTNIKNPKYLYMCFPHSSNVSDFGYCHQSLGKLHGVSFASINVCGLVYKLDYISTLLLHSDIDVLCVNETLLTEIVDDSLLVIPGV